MPPRPKRLRKMSKKQKRALGLPSDSESDPSSSSGVEEEQDSEEEGRPPTANTSQTLLTLSGSQSTTSIVPESSVPSVLARSQSTASIVSQLSTSGTAIADESGEKQSKFDERFQTATSTDEDVLSMLFFFQCSSGPDQFLGRATDGNLDFPCLPTLQDAPNHYRQEGESCIYVYLYCVCDLFSGTDLLC